jgi:hypothetical protein
VTPVCRKFTGKAPVVAPTVKVVLPTVSFSDPDAIVAVRLILFGTLLAVWPRIVRVVVVVIVAVAVPFKKRAKPLPLVVDRVSVIGVALLDGETVAVMGADLPCGTTGVPENVTVGPTDPPPPLPKLCTGQFPAVQM